MNHGIRARRQQAKEMNSLVIGSFVKMMERDVEDIANVGTRENYPTRQPEIWLRFFFFYIHTPIGYSVREKKSRQEGNRSRAHQLNSLWCYISIRLARPVSFSLPDSSHLSVSNLIEKKNYQAFTWAARYLCRVETYKIYPRWWTNPSPKIGSSGGLLTSCTSFIDCISSATRLADDGKREGMS